MAEMKFTTFATAFLSNEAAILVFSPDRKEQICGGCQSKKFLFWLYSSEKGEVTCFCAHCGQTKSFPKNYLLHKI